MPSATHPAFELLRQQKIPSLNVVLEEYRHQVTGAQHIHLASDNTENVFLVALRTLPTDSTGVAHILEHTALCGSEKYHVRDPFFMMIRRSLNTFMNAFTSSDWTAYPFASQNRKDFNNLLDVYLDAVFFSRLDPLDFSQEGHRVEFETADDPSTPLVFKGVVFNEMKGAMSSVPAQLWQATSKYLHSSNNTYHYNSGGDPEYIPDLSYEELVSFYKKHYHPSNAIFMTFGDITAAEHQAKFEEQVLSRFERLDCDISVSDSKPLHAPLLVQERYPLEEATSDDGDATKGKTHHVIAWLLGNSSDLTTTLEARLLSNILLDNSASPLLHALETTELGSAPSPMCGLNDGEKRLSFMCGIEGSEPEHTAAFSELIDKVLQDVATNGVPQEQVDACLHQLELQQREVGGDGYPFGLQLMLQSLTAATHHGDVLGLLDLDPALELLRERIQDKNYIPSLARKFLIENTHKVQLTFVPDTNISAGKIASETARLAAMKAQLSDQEKQDIVDLAAALKERQQQEDDNSVLPKVTLQDVPPETPYVFGATQTLANQQLTTYAAGTNGLVYQQMILDLPTLTEREWQLLPYLTLCLTELGVGDKTYLETQAWQAEISGGISAFTSVRGQINDAQNVKGILTISGKALNRNQVALSELMKSSWENTRFDEHSRIRELVAQVCARQEASLTGAGHSLAMGAACSRMSPTARLTYQQSGLAGIAEIKALTKRLEQDEALAQFADKLKALHQKVLNCPRQFLLVCEAEHLDAFSQSLEQQWNKPTAELSAIDGDLGLPPISEPVRMAWLTNTQVNFCAKAYPSVPTDHPDTPALTVLAGFLRNGYLHRVIREQGGAYGGGASQDSGVAAFRFYSYRDPRLSETLDDFDQSLQWLATNNHKESALEEAILGVVASLDKPGSPAGEARQTFHNELFGRDLAQRQRFRERTLKVTIADLQRVAKTYLQPEKASIAVIAPTTSEESVRALGLEVHTL